jgi:hypothetical protein
MAGKRRDEQVAALLHAPLGILLTIRFIEEINTTPFHPFLAEHFSELVIEETSNFRFNTLSTERLAELVVECVTDPSPHAPDYRQRVEVLLTRGPSLWRAAEQLLDAPGTANWFTDLDRGRQVWLSPDGRSPTPVTFSAELRPLGGQVPKPRGALWTSTSLGTCPSHWIPYLRKGEDSHQPPYHPWRLEVSPAANIYEIHGPQAWHSLCLASPYYGPDNIVLPNWEAVARTWDGVHLSMGGLLTSEGVRWSTPEGWTQITGWNVESTVWLRWVFDQLEHLPDTE